jgi:hypothetical protein
MLRHAVAAGDRVERALPFPVVTNPDAVVLDKNGLVSGLAIVAHWHNADNSHMKYYRTRAEYVDVLRAVRLNPDAFNSAFVPITILYGTATGWKDEILGDLIRGCPEVLFLPTTLGAACADRLTKRAFAVYEGVHAADPAGARDYVERHFAEPSNLDDDDRSLIELLRRVWRDKTLRARVHKKVEEIVDHLPAATVPEQPFRTRYRQGLVLAALFSPSEIRAWLTGFRHGGEPEQDIEKFVRRGVFFDIVDVVRIPRIGRVDVRAEARRPYREEGGDLHYAPDQVDFESWEAIGPELALYLLDTLKDHARSHPKVFAAGARNLAYGNWESLARTWEKELPAVCRALRKADAIALAKLLHLGANPVSVEAFHNLPDFGVLGNPVRQVVIAAVATATDDRRTLRRLAIRATPDGGGSEGSLAAAVLDEDTGVVIELLKELRSFCAVLCHGEYQELAGVPRPALLSLGHSGSWLSSMYGNLVTNSTFNPLSVALREHLEALHNGGTIDGWPEVRSLTLQRISPRVEGRVQWQFAVRGGESQPHVLAETKTITANNWGNKSKEIYGRVAQTREEFEQIGQTVELLGVLDGDIDQGALEELATGVGYDTVVSVNTVLAGVADRRGMASPLLSAADA